MDPLTQIELLIATTFITGPLTAFLLSYLNGRQAAAKEKRDYARQDEVARRAETASKRAEDAARDAAAHTKVAIAAIAENTDLTRKNTDLTRQIEVSTNSMKGALVKATDLAAGLAGEKRGREDEVKRQAGIAEGKKAAEKAADDERNGIDDRGADK